MERFFFFFFLLLLRAELDSGLPFIYFSPVLKNKYLLCAGVCLELGILRNIRIGPRFRSVDGLEEKTRTRSCNAN